MSSAASVEDSENKPVVQTVNSCQRSGVTAHIYWSRGVVSHLKAVLGCSKSL